MLKAKAYRHTPDIEAVILLVIFLAVAIIFERFGKPNFEALKRLCVCVFILISLCDISKMKREKRWFLKRKTIIDL